MKERILAFLALFTSASTLLCCALPALLVSLGLGMAAAGIFTALPWLRGLIVHKTWLFLVAAGLIGGNFWLVYRPTRRPACEVPPGGGPSGCETGGRFTRGVLWISVVLYTIGFLSAYGLPWILGQG